MRCKEGTSCKEGLITQKCCHRLHIYYGAYHDGEKYWLPLNAMQYFVGSSGPAFKCDYACGACTLLTTPVCGPACIKCDHHTEGDHWNALYCSPIGCCTDANGYCRIDDPPWDGGCSNCDGEPCPDPSYAPFCCNFDKRNWCDFMGEGGTLEDWWEEGYMEADCHERNWGPNEAFNDCFLDYEPYYWESCGIGGWGLRPGDEHVGRMYRLDDEEDSPTYGEQIPCNGEPECGDGVTALYDLYNINGGGGIEPYTPHILIVYAKHVREGTSLEVNSSFVVKGMWITCSSKNNIRGLPAYYGNVDEHMYPCHCDKGACCLNENCFQMHEWDCWDQGGEWMGPDNCDDYKENPCV